MKKDKEWAIKGTKSNISSWSNYPDEDEYAKGRLKGAKEMLNILKQLDEPVLPVIPRFVADWIEDIDGNKNYLFRFIMRYPWNEDRDTNGIPEEIIHWIFETDDNILLILKLIKNDTDYTIEKEPTWTVKLDKGRYVDNFIESITGVEVELSHRLGCTAPIRFKDKSKAEAVALLVGGEVVEVSE